MILFHHKTLAFPNSGQLLFPGLFKTPGYSVLRSADHQSLQLRDLGEWASEVGVNKLILGRLFTAQNGISFRAWRQQGWLLRALELLATCDDMTTIALELELRKHQCFHRDVSTKSGYDTDRLFEHHRLFQPEKPRCLAIYLLLYL